MRFFHALVNRVALRGNCGRLTGQPMTERAFASLSTLITFCYVYWETIWYREKNANDRYHARREGKLKFLRIAIPDAYCVSLFASNNSPVYARRGLTKYYKHKSRVSGADEIFTRYETQYMTMSIRE